MSVFVPCHDVGIGTGRAVVVDLVTRQPVRMTVEAFALVDGVVCVKGESVRSDGEKHLVRFPGGATAWVCLSDRSTSGTESAA